MHGDFEFAYSTAVYLIILLCLFYRVLGCLILFTGPFLLLICFGGSTWAFTLGILYVILRVCMDFFTAFIVPCCHVLARPYFLYMIYQAYFPSGWVHILPYFYGVGSSCT